MYAYLREKLDGRVITVGDPELEFLAKGISTTEFYLRGLTDDLGKFGAKDGITLRAFPKRERSSTELEEARYKSQCHNVLSLEIESDYIDDIKTNLSRIEEGYRGIVDKNGKRIRFQVLDEKLVAFAYHLLKII